MKESLHSHFQRIIDNITADGKLAQSRKEYRNILQGERGLAKCYVRSCLYSNGKRDCGCLSCQVYGIMLYRGVI